MSANFEMESSDYRIGTYIRIRKSIKESALEFAALDYKTFTRLIEVALIEYMVNHKGDIKRPVNLTVNQVNEVKSVKVQCEIGKCNGKFNGSIGTYQGKAYNLCSDHAHKFAGLKGWVIK
jgi:hypothetical protein